MIALDTNVLVRYLVADDARQAKAARLLLEGLTTEHPGFICREVIVELVWVYGGSKQVLINMDAQDFFRKRLACNPEHPQIRTRSLPEPASRAAASRSGYPVHPVHPCLL